MKIQAVIPARLHSTRLPEKLLRDLSGKSIIQRVYENTCSFKIFDNVLIATDSEKILTHAKNFTENVILTSENHESGTSRISEVNESLNSDIIVNIQGDEPFLKAEPVINLIESLKNSDSLVGTLAYKTDNEDEAYAKSSVKVVCSNSGKALYFSRLPIPATRDDNQKLPDWLIHIGIYAFKREFFTKYKSFKPSLLEKFEKLEQLSFLENDVEIIVAKTNEPTLGIDTEQDLEMARRLI